LQFFEFRLIASLPAQTHSAVTVRTARDKRFAANSALFQRFIDSRRGKLLQRVDDLENKIKSPQRRGGTQEGDLGY
jgi:hypothetical protein